MKNDPEFGSTPLEAGEGLDTARNAELLATYQAQIEAAEQAGNPERERFYRAKADSLRAAADQAEAGEAIGSAPFPEIREHRDAAMKYESKANELERKIQRGQEDKSRMSEVRRLRNKAEQERREMEQAKRHYQEQLKARAIGGGSGDASREISFGGGLGTTEIIHLRGSAKLSDANNKRSRASDLASQARRARDAGDFSKASSLESEARSLRSEANTLEAEGKKLKDYKPKKT